MISESAISLINKKVGDNITLDIGKRLSAGGQSLESPALWEYETMVKKKQRF
ncbi:hypothetical protein [Paraclostridium sp. AKS73]|uniref:hypothetical protein n=1 Tax=Paraclostridium sp. AKS73 TaxID=2876116 RepID=UPI0021DFFA9D|nr:hypothetical protein [Paraclostridium sp. AKS73]MCU9815288.1 hypothetical protein [Paraclostridium sp. AKS73]